MRRFDVAVIGGGVVGGTIAFALQKHGLAVALFDAALRGSASRASAGMLAPYPEGLSGQILRWGEEGLERYPTILADLERLTGEAVPASFQGTWMVATSDAELTRLGKHDPLPGWLERIRGARGGRKDPGGYVNPQRLKRALINAFLALGGTQVKARIRGYEAGATQVTLTDGQRRWRADRLVIAAGAWSAAFGLPVRPVKGEALLLLAPPPPAPVFVAEGYAVPRDRGLYIGATTREQHAPGVDLFGLRWLADFAHETFPHLEGARLSQVLWGYRPMAEAPIVGPIETRVFAATGHGRNGVLLAPATARKVAEWLGASEGGE